MLHVSLAFASKRNATGCYNMMFWIWKVRGTGKAVPLFNWLSTSQEDVLGLDIRTHILLTLELAGGVWPALPPEEEPPVSIRQKASWVPELVCMTWRGEESVPYWHSNSNLSAMRSVASWCSIQKQREIYCSLQWDLFRCSQSVELQQRT
jgi:hypothetical protein